MKIRRVFIIIPLVLLVLALALSSNILLRLFFLSILILLISYFWASFGARGIRVQVGKLPERSQVGAWFNEEFTLFNDSRVPKLLLKLEENTDLTGYYNTKMLNLLPKSSLSWQTNVYCQRRGRYRLGSTTITVSDPFGFFRQSHNFGEPHYLLIYPATLELPFFEASSPSSLDYTAGGWLIGRISPNVSSVREFVNGDSLNHIHWPSTAHAGKLMVKVFEGDHSPSVSKNVYIMADMHQTSRLGQGDESTEEYTVTIAASLIKKYLDSEVAVGLIAAGNQLYSFPPERGEQHLHHMLEALALVRATGKTSIDQIISNEIRRISDGSTVIIISPATTPRLVDAIRHLKIRSNLVTAVLLDAASFGGTTSSSNIARSLNLLDIQTYLVRKGDELPRVLNRRANPLLVRHI